MSPPGAAGTLAPGRRRDGAATRAALVTAARRQFASQPYADVTLRAIAEEAAVSPALVIKYFGSKERLLEQASDYGERFDELLDAPRQRLGRHLVATLLPYTDGGGDPMLGLVFMAGKRGAPEKIRDALRDQFVRRLAARLDGPAADLRAELACAHLVGVAVLRRVMRTPALAASTPDTLVNEVGRRIQRLLDGD
jgi:AcrR family transcriptional regulator